MTVGARDEFHRGNAGCSWAALAAKGCPFGRPCDTKRPIMNPSAGSQHIHQEPEYEPTRGVYMNPSNRVHMNPRLWFIYTFTNYLPVILKSSLLLRIHTLKHNSRFITQIYKKTNGLGSRFITRVHMNPCSGFIIGHVFTFPLPKTTPRGGAI